MKTLHEVILTMISMRSNFTLKQLDPIGFNGLIE